MNILGICASLRSDSSNARLLRAAQEYLHAHRWTIFDLRSLPYFEPENQYGEGTPTTVRTFRTLAAASDLIFMTTPEYAHGIPGILKNGLEWLFCEGTVGKPVAVVIGSGQGQAVRDQLLDVLRTMDFAVSPDRLLPVQSAQPKIGADAKILDENTRGAFEGFLNRIVGVV